MRSLLIALITRFLSFLRFTWYFSQCSEPLAVGFATKLILDDKVDVIIGPPCSICTLLCSYLRCFFCTAAVVAGMLGNYYNVPIVSWAAKQNDLSDKERFPTFARTVATTRS